MPAAALAAPLTVQVVNGRGVEQASRVSDAAGTHSTNGHGRVVLDVAPSEQVSATRGAAAPEGAGGVSLTVPNPVPAAPVRLTVPALPDAVAPAHDSTEAWMLDRVNDERAALGRAALRQSGSLNRAADVMARYLLATGQFSHYALYATRGSAASIRVGPSRAARVSVRCSRWRRRRSRRSPLGRGAQATGPS